jgi:predicted metal-dependent peptidase
MPRELMNGVDVTVYVDTSGSISEANLESAVREIADIIDLSGGSVRWLEGDAVILKDEWINAAPEKLNGGGGTSFVPLFEHLADSPTKTLVIFTDTEGEMPDFIPTYPVIWAIYAKTQEEAEARAIPFGESVAIPASSFA